MRYEPQAQSPHPQFIASGAGGFRLSRRGACILIRIFHLLLLSQIFTFITSASTSSSKYYSHCDADSIPASQKISTLTPNNFYKICPPFRNNPNKKLSQPICGDGTPFSFFVRSPVQKYSNTDKILIEFQGGGACWDYNSCQRQGERLSFPEGFNDFVGYGCSEAAYVMEKDGYGGYPINFLCSSQMGDVNFEEYNYIIVPYCTQDVHLGDNIMFYDNNGDGGDDVDYNYYANKYDDDQYFAQHNGVYHHGAHNTMAVLRWIQQNFPNPSHIALTGCSAGATPLPVIYDLLNQHYNKGFASSRSVNINVMMDSPVYLTPEYFLQNNMGHWNPWTILKLMSFRYEKWRYNVYYSTRIWEWALRRGSRQDKWGFISHTYDPVSEAYWKAMGGGYYYYDNQDDDNDYYNNDIDDGNYYNNNDDGESSWYTDLRQSIRQVVKRNNNVQTYFMDGEGHCSFGLYYASLTDGFNEWAGTNIFAEQRLFGRKSASVFFFYFSLCLGMGWMFMGIGYSSKRRMRQLNSQLSGSSSVADGSTGSGGSSSSSAKGGSVSNQSSSFRTRRQNKMLKKLEPLFIFGKPIEQCPVSAGYLTVTTIYFLLMMLFDGFAHPLNNPSLGPTAQVLSVFGINNPTLIVREHETYRLLSSNFVCSGILTYLIVMVSVIRVTRLLEKTMDAPKMFLFICCTIMGGCNLVYTMFGNGASAASVPFVLGMNTFSTVMSVALGSEFGVKRPIVQTIVTAFITCMFLPFNSWIMILAAIAIGGIILPNALEITNSSLTEPLSISGMSFLQERPEIKLKPKALKAVMMTYLAMFLLILVGVPRPNKIYKYPFFTGCSMMYSTDVDDYVNNYAGGDRIRRRLEDNNEEEEDNKEDNADDEGNNQGNLCAQICVPHLIDKPFYHGVSKTSYIPMTPNYGVCDDADYEYLVADKTITFWNYPLDVELYKAEGDEED